MTPKITYSVVVASLTLAFVGSVARGASPLPIIKPRPPALEITLEEASHRLTRPDQDRSGHRRQKTQRVTEILDTISLLMSGTAALLIICGPNDANARGGGMKYFIDRKKLAIERSEPQE